MVDNYYVYIHSLASGQIFYIGKGKDKRAWSSSGRSARWREIASSGFIVDIVHCQLSEVDALEKERELIKLHKDSICNVTSGGQGISGYRHSEESKRKIAEKNKLIQTGKVRSKEHREAIGNGSRGKKKSKEMVAKLKATKNQDKYKKIAAEVGRRNATDQDIRKKRFASLSKAMKGRVFSNEHRVNLSRSQGGKKVRCIETQTIFETASEAAKWLQANGKPSAFVGNITNQIKGKHKTAYGFTWEFVD